MMSVRACRVGWRGGRRWSAAVVGAAALASAAVAQPVYQVTDLGSLAGPTGASGAQGLSSSGEVVGASTGPSTSAVSGGFRPFVWGPVPGTPVPMMRDLLPGVAGSGFATDRNSGGLSVGTFRRASTGTTQGFVVGGIATVVPPVTWIMPLQGGTTTSASAINASGVVVGSSSIAFGPLPPSATHAIRWQNGQTQGLGTLGGKNSEALGINGGGTIVGVSDVPPASPTVQARRRGFVLPAGSNVMQALPSLSNSGGSWASDISEFNTIVGSADWAPPSITPFATVRPTRAVMWTPNSTSIVNLGVLRNTDTSSEALAVNTGVEIVGWSGTVSNAIAPSVGASPLPGGTSTRAFIWRDGVMTDLNSLIPAGSGWVLHAATDIGESGAIVGWGTRTSTTWVGPRFRAFLLTPVP